MTGSFGVRLGSNKASPSGAGISKGAVLRSVNSVAANILFGPVVLALRGLRTGPTLLTLTNASESSLADG